MKVGIFGRGRLGAAVSRLLALEPDMELAWALGKDAGIPGPVDVALDASVGSAVPGHIAWAKETGTNLVIGTTGWDGSELTHQSPWPIAVMIAPNFSLSIAFLKRIALALGRFAALDPASDLVILERHHRAKLDAPSGTAKLLASALKEGCPRYAHDTVAEALPAGGVLQIASLRAGSEVGYHELRLEAANEALVISHEAKSRDLFAQGAIRALGWLAGKKGLFTFDDLAAELLSPLFLPPREK